jgi:hypothetical protein
MATGFEELTRFLVLFDLLEFCFCFTSVENTRSFLILFSGIIVGPSFSFLDLSVFWFLNSSWLGLLVDEDLGSSLFGLFGSES